MPRTLTRIAALLASAALAVLLACVVPGRALAQAVSKVVDPNTSSRWEEVLGGGAGGGGYSTDQAGRIWVDKSVYGSTDEARSAGLNVTLADERHGFAVGLSALSSAVSVRQEGGPAHDVVFVVSTNRVLSDLSFGGRHQAAYLADALNTSIARLMAQNDGSATPTRVSVIGYDSDVVTLMPLDVYEPDQDGHYVRFLPGSGGAAGSLEVVATAKSGAETADAALGSGSYLQRAVHLAGESLVGAAGDAGAAEREPVLVVMGVETPPMASVSLFDPPTYTGDAAGFLGPLPGTRVTGYGTDALLATLLTMRHEASRVDKAWGEGRGLAFYTVGLDTSETAAYLLETPLEQAAHELPGSGAATGQDLRDNLKEAARAYAEAAAVGEKSVELDLFGSGRGGLTPAKVTLPVEGGLVPADDPLAVSPVDDYLPARSARALTWALGSAVGRSLGVSYTAPASGGPGEDAPGGSRVQLTDRIGAGMQVTRVDGIVYGSHLLSGAGAAQAVKVSLEDPYNPDATHEFSYLVEAMNARYNLGSETYGLFYQALVDGQFSYASDDDFSNHASWYVNEAHEMVPSQGSSYTFATQAEVDAAADGNWQERADEDVRGRIEAAQAAGATAVCETYFYIGDYRSQYSGGDVTLYDFVVMVETSLATGRQELLLSIPVEAVPALRADVSVRADGTATMRLDEALETTPIRLAYQVAPTPAVSALLERMEAGELVSDAELEGALGEKVAHGGLATRLIFASDFTGSGDSAEAGATANAWAAQTNSYYAFTRDTPLLVRQGSAYVPLATMPVAGETYYFERTTYSASFPSPDDEVPASVERTYAPYVMAEGAAQAESRFVLQDGQCVALAGTPRYVTAETLGSVEKIPNATASAPYVERLSVEAPESGGVHLVASLGNNGALVVPAGVGLGTLRVSKGVDGGAPGASFAFTVTLRDADGTSLSGEVGYRVGDSAETAVLDDSGSFSAKLSDGQELVVEGIPEGTRYLVREDDYSASGYLSLQTGSEGTIEADGEALVSFTNVWSAGGLGIASVMAGNDAEPDRAVSFEVVVRGLFAAHPGEDELTFEATRHAGDQVSKERLVFSRVEGGTDGVARVEGLTGGSGLLVSGLPEGASYTVSELDADALVADGYVIYAGSADEVAAGREATSAEGTVAGGDAVSAAYFVHVREKDPDPTPDPDPDPTPDPDPDPSPGTDPTPTPDPTPEPEPDPEPDPEPEPDPDPTPEPDPEPNPEPTPDPDHDPTPEPEGEEANGQADAEPLPESGDATSSPGVLLAVGACGVALVAAGIVVARRRGGR
ncbi:DUF7601 domain-containing protein [Thermophilibacter provencensis]|uniref:DUF5979 domain-containing protein n=1 Tax=Thermophilibacter provencensis TaxID=1852386 RepID=A0ABT7V2K0_9ACTN|nr:DUF5979 domain-containing protein [Thermophilibacter provencensis]MDM8270216.1 DUF5979 domain-containing protein [Thermophilibacter provencensis]